MYWSLSQHAMSGKGKHSLSKRFQVSGSDWLESCQQIVCVCVCVCVCVWGGGGGGGGGSD